MELTDIKEFLIDDIIQGWELAEEDHMEKGISPESICLHRLSQPEIDSLAQIAATTILSDIAIIWGEIN